MAEKAEHGHVAGTRGHLPWWLLPSLAFFCLWFVSLCFLDIPVAKYMREYKMPRHLEETLVMCNSMAKAVPLVVLVLAAAIAVNGEKWRMLGRLILAMLIGPLAAVWAGKLSVGRLRPRWFTGSQWQETFTGFFPNFNDAKRVHFDSFPSGDAALAFAVAFILAQYFPRHRFILYFLAVGCAAERIFSQYHYISDVLLGAMIGYLSARIVQYISAPTGR